MPYIASKFIFERLSFCYRTCIVQMKGLGRTYPKHFYVGSRIRPTRLTRYTQMCMKVVLIDQLVELDMKNVCHPGLLELTTFSASSLQPPIMVAKSARGEAWNTVHSRALTSFHNEPSNSSASSRDDMRKDKWKDSKEGMC